MIALIEFPSMEAVQAFVNAPAYTKYRQARQTSSVSRLHVIDGTDVAGSIPYLPTRLINSLTKSNIDLS